MLIAVTLDDGPSEWTEQILDLFATHEPQKATFFVCGHAIEGREHLLQRMAAEGHEIGNHTLTHSRLTGLTDDAVRYELQTTQLLVERACHVEPEFFRAPHFDTDKRVNEIALTYGLRHVGCTYDPQDWARDSGEGIADAVERSAQDRDVIDLHDGIPPGGGNGTSSRQPTVDAIRLLLERMTYADFVTVADL